MDYNYDILHTMYCNSVLCKALVRTIRLCEAYTDGQRSSKGSSGSPPRASRTDRKAGSRVGTATEVRPILSCSSGTYCNLA